MIVAATGAASLVAAGTAALFAGRDGPLLAMVGAGAFAGAAALAFAETHASRAVPVWVAVTVASSALAVALAPGRTVLALGVAAAAIALRHAPVARLPRDGTRLLLALLAAVLAPALGLAALAALSWRADRILFAGCLVAGAAFVALPDAPGMVPRAARIGFLAIGFALGAAASLVGERQALLRPEGRRALLHAGAALPALAFVVLILWNARTGRVAGGDAVAVLAWGFAAMAASLAAVVIAIGLVVAVSTLSELRWTLLASSASALLGFALLDASSGLLAFLPMSGAAGLGVSALSARAGRGP